MEKYGTIPPRFTKAWWEYFWEYYKWHTISTVFVLVLVAVTAVQCATQTKYDLSLTYAGDAMLADETVDSISAALSEVIADCDGNDERKVFFQQLSLGSNMQNADPQYEMAMSTKLMLEFTAGESYIFIFSKEMLDTYLNREDCESLFLPVSDWADTEPDKESLALAGGVAYAVKLTDSTYLNSLGLNMENQYLLVRAPRVSETDDERLMTQYESSLAAANYLIAK